MWILKLQLIFKCSVLLNHYQLPQTAYCQVSHPLLYYQLAVSQVAATATQSLV